MLMMGRQPVSLEILVAEPRQLGQRRLMVDDVEQAAESLLAYRGRTNQLVDHNLGHRLLVGQRLEQLGNLNAHLFGIEPQGFVAVNDAIQFFFDGGHHALVEFVMLLAKKYPATTAAPKCPAIALAR